MVGSYIGISKVANYIVGSLPVKEVWTDITKVFPTSTYFITLIYTIGNNANKTVIKCANEDELITNINSILSGNSSVNMTIEENNV